MDYYEYILCYVNDVLDIICNPMRTIEGIKSMFKLKDDKSEPLELYLRVLLDQVEMQDGTNFWTMLSEQ